MKTSSRVSVQAGNNDTEITLGLLNAIKNESGLTQRSLASDLGIALGLANAYLKRCVKKGFVKVQQIPSNRFAYYLTPQGFAEKSRLTAEYLSQSFNFFRIARRQCSDIFAACAENRLTNVALWGASDLAEIVILCASEYPVELSAVIEPGRAGESFHGLPVVGDYSELSGLDAIIITELNHPQSIYEKAISAFPRVKVFAPDILHIDALS